MRRVPGLGVWWGRGRERLPIAQRLRLGHAHELLLELADLLVLRERADEKDEDAAAEDEVHGRVKAEDAGRPVCDLGKEGEHEQGQIMMVGRCAQNDRCHMR